MGLSERASGSRKSRRRRSARGENVERMRVWALACVGVTVLFGCATSQDAPPASEPVLVNYTEARAPCANRSATRNAYFGDLHIHTAYSYDARPRGTETTPEDAYRFAQGEPIAVPPYDGSDEGDTVVQLRRPLDFAAVTDHSEFFGEMQGCYDPSSRLYALESCRHIREGANEGLFPMFRAVAATEPGPVEGTCGTEPAACKAAAATLWHRTQAMAEAAYDRSAACTFTSFVGYEYTGTPNANNIHRNVIFRNAQVPKRAISYIDAPSDRSLWEQLMDQCLRQTEGCDVLAIPHNSNLSAGAMFPSYVGGAESAESAREMAQVRNAMEPVMEIFQHKGNSECFNGLPDILGDEDELCNTEQVVEVGRIVEVAGAEREITFCEDGEVGSRGFQRAGCISKNDFYRSVLLTGMQDAATLGINSYKLGVIASTDTHLSLAGHTDEAHWHGHLSGERDLADRLTDIDTFAGNLAGNPGGLAGVWAVENARDAIFEALRRREVFGTTGTRIEPRLFGGWDFAGNVCAMDDRATHGYARGTAMGGDFSTRPTDGTPELFAAARRDPDAAPLQKLQIIKGWVDAGGQAHYKVFDVAGEDADGRIDPTTGDWNGPGADDLCTVFRDPEFDPIEPAYYYLRVVEVPTLRWSRQACVALPESQRPPACDNAAAQVIQELAWTSPIWYLPEP